MRGPRHACSPSAREPSPAVGQHRRARASYLARRVFTHDMLRLALLVAVAAFALDWLSKTWALRALQDTSVSLGTLFVLSLERNEGLAFSTGSGLLPADLVLTLRVLMSLLLLYLARNAVLRSRRYATGFALLVAGGLGNAADLAFRNGAVVDFIGAGPYTFQWAGDGMYFGIVFNVADLAILGGIILIAPQIRVWAAATRRWLARWDAAGLPSRGARA